MRVVILLYLFVLNINFCLTALTIGSDSAVSRQALVTFPTATANIILGGAVMENGFVFTDALTTCSFSSFFSVLGPVNLQQGILTLLTDLIFEDPATFTYLGNIFGNSRVLELAPSVTYLQMTSAVTSNVVWDNLKVILNSDIIMRNGIEFTGNCSLDGRGHVVELVDDAELIAGTGATLKLKDVVIENVKTGKIQGLNSVSTYSLQNVEFVLSDDWNFSTGKLVVLDEFKISGTNKFIYTSDQVSTISFNSSLIFDSAITFSYNPTSNNRDLIQLLSATSLLELRGATLYSTTTGLRLTKGTFRTREKSYLVAEGSVSTQAISFGDGTVANNVTIIPNADLEIDGFVQYNNTA
ncbi:MAG: hypothetical protein UR26_C0002G0238 [candidate division TM6 bacterium GW2011_GWF2_32_72]|nr:MAG: hypothetical protein UR26_C0002G0238 [candidate division TM6 bacterium GW2011_GWF2_32_72]